MIGVEIQDRKKGQAPGAEVVGFQKGSPAAEAGFLEGDVIVAVHGTPVSGIDDTARAIAALQPGTIAKMVVLRENREKTLPIRIGSAEQMVLSNPMAAPLLRQKGMASMGGEIPAGETPATGAEQKDSATDELF